MTSAYQLKTLRIGPRTHYLAVGANNPMEAVVEVEHDKTSVRVTLSPETIAKILSIIVPAVTSDLRRQMESFAFETTEALALSAPNNTKAIEG